MENKQNYSTRAMTDEEKEKYGEAQPNRKLPSGITAEALLKAISQTVDNTLDKNVKKAVEKILGAKESTINGRDYFKDTERLLYSYPDLKLKLAMDEEELNNNQMVQKRKSADIVRFGGSGKRPDDPDEEYLNSRMVSINRTKKEVERIDKALDTISDEPKYTIIPMKYFKNKTMEEISEALACDERTVRRNKNRLINRLKIIFFGAEALNNI